MYLLSTPKSNPKVVKNIGQGVLTAPLHLAPYNLSGFNVCPMATEGCIKSCLNTAGRGGIFKKGEDTNVIQQARIRKTKMFFNDRHTFLSLLVQDIEKLERKAKKESLSCGVRLNATSDIAWEVIKVKHAGKTYNNLMELFPNVQFYDYTAITKRAVLWATNKFPSNYHLTFSAKESNQKDVKIVANHKGNIAVVFRTKDFPKYYMSLPVINGDEHDYRPVDPKGCIVALKAKGKAKYDTSGFVR